MPRRTPLPSLVFCLLLASGASAGHPPAAPDVPAPDCAPPPPRTIVNRQLLLVPKEEAIALPALKLREIEVGTATGLALDFYEEKRKVTELELKECEVEQKVVCREMKAVTVKDPCTGK